MANAKKKMSSTDLASYLELENKKDEIRLLWEEKKEIREKIEKWMKTRSKRIKELRMNIYYPERSR